MTEGVFQRCLNTSNSILHKKVYVPVVSSQSLQLLRVKKSKIFVFFKFDALLTFIDGIPETL